MIQPNTVVACTELLWVGAEHASLKIRGTRLNRQPEQS